MPEVNTAPKFEVLKVNFYRKYSNMPLADRDNVAVVRHQIEFTFTDLYLAVKDDAKEAPVLLEDLWSLDQRV